MNSVGCPVRRGSTRLQDQGGRPRSRFYEIVHRIAGRLEPEVATAFLEAVEATRDMVDVAALEAAVRSGDESAILTALRTTSLSAVIDNQDNLRQIFARGFGATAEASASVLSDALSVDFAFDARDPRAIVFARRQVGTLVTRLTDDQVLAVRSLVSRGLSEGIPPRRTARAIHRIVGIRHDWAQAPSNLRTEILAGHEGAATSRRLDAVTKQKIRKRIRDGTVTEAFLDEVEVTYTHSLRRRRALDIARTETIRANGAGREESWREAQRRGVITDQARRFWIVTPDDRLRETHAAVPDMNPDGVAIGEPFDTPIGAVLHEPMEPLCRCSVGLVPNPGQGGII